MPRQGSRRRRWQRELLRVASAPLGQSPSQAATEQEATDDAQSNLSAPKFNRRWSIDHSSDNRRSREEVLVLRQALVGRTTSQEVTEHVGPTLPRKQRV